MGIFDRLGNVINSYLNDFGRETGDRFKSHKGDPDLDAAYEELNDFLNKDSGRTENAGRYSWRDTDQKRGAYSEASGAKSGLPPEELRADFEILEVPFGANEETCKAAYKKLLMIHHPDRHAGHDGNVKKATEKSSKINAAWDRIEKYHKTKTPRSGSI